MIKFSLLNTGILNELHMQETFHKASYRKIWLNWDILICRLYWKFLYFYYVKKYASKLDLLSRRYSTNLWLSDI